MSLLSVVFEKSAIEIGPIFKCEFVGDPLNPLSPITKIFKYGLFYELHTLIRPKIVT